MRSSNFASSAFTSATPVWRRALRAVAVLAALALATALYGRADFAVDLANLWALCGF